jgi:hypothetical protein
MADLDSVHRKLSGVSTDALVGNLARKAGLSPAEYLKRMGSNFNLTKHTEIISEADRVTRATGALEDETPE